MTQYIETIFENGVFRPIHPVEGFEEKTKVNLAVVSLLGENHPLREAFGILPDEDAQEMLKIINEEFGKVHLSEW